MGKPLVLQGLFRAPFYGLAAYAYEMCLLADAKWVARHRPFVGLNRTLERVTDG